MQGTHLILERFPGLLARIPTTARPFELSAAGCFFAGYATVAATVAQPWLFAGALPASVVTPPDIFVACVRSRQSDELLVFQAAVQRFSFLERIQTPWTDNVSEAIAAWGEALRRWDAGSSVSYAHRFL